MRLNRNPYILMVVIFALANEIIIKNNELVIGRRSCIAAHGLIGSFVIA